MNIILPNGSPLELADNASAMDAALKISEGLARVVVAAKINGELKEMSTLLNEGDKIELIKADNPEGLAVFWHSSAHIMAEAVKIIYPEVKVAIGPSIDRGFYYDFDKPEPFTPEDFAKIEAEMKKIVKAKKSFDRKVVSKQEAIDAFSKIDEVYKVELINELPENETISTYTQGEFTDLCRGPHIPSTGMVKSFKLMSNAGAYWRGSEKNPMLQRIYAISFPDKKQLKEHLRLLEEAAKRDHRKLGKEMDLFSFHEEGTGFPFWHAKGMVIYNTLVDYWREVHTRENYGELKTPMMLNRSLWEKSGHWDNYKDNMYFTQIDDVDFAVKPMNCPGGILVYKSKLNSYRDLPIRLSELGTNHRHEPSGTLHGLFRARAFTQDDAHIYMTPDMIEQEIKNVINLIFEVYGVFGFKDIKVELSTRPEEKFIGDLKTWDLAEAALKSALDSLNIEYIVNKGDGAFYGPKIDFHISDCMKRTWQCGTIQLDFNMPEKFELEYIGEDNARHRPVMIHRVVFGSIERFIGVLLEHFAGDFPLWIAPVQVCIIPVSEKYFDYAYTVIAELKKQGIRAEIDLRSEKVGYKIRAAEKGRFPFMLVVGETEEKDNTVSVRRRKIGDVGILALNEFIKQALEEIKTKKLPMEEKKEEN